MSEFRFFPLALGMLLAGCGLFQARQPDVPDTLTGADHVYAALPTKSLAMSCNDVRNAASNLDQAGMSGQWDAATIEDIRRRLDYLE